MLKTQETPQTQSDEPDHNHNHNQLHEHDHDQITDHQPIPFSKAEERAFILEGCRVVLGAACIHIVLGTFYMWGTISVYVASYLRNYDDSVTVEKMKGVFPYMMIAINAFLSFGVKLANKIGFKLTSLIFMVWYAACIFLCSFIKSFILFVIVYAAVMGVAGGILYMVPVVCGWKYFPQRKGLVSGIIVGGYGLGTFIFNFIALAIVNPNNEKASIVYDGEKYFGPEVYNNVPKMFRILALCFLILGIIGTILIKTPSRKYIEHAEEAAVLTKKGVSKEVVTTHNECQSVRQGLKSRPFYLILGMVLFGTFLGYLMANNYKVYGLENINDDSFLTLVGSIGSATNGCSRAVWALLYDKFGFKKVYFCLLILQAVLAATLNFISSVKALYLIWYALIMGCEGGQIAMFPAVTAKVFGAKVGPVIYGFIFVGYTLTNIGAYLLTTFGLDAVGWGGVFWICFSFTILSGVLNSIFNIRYEFK